MRGEGHARLVLLHALTRDRRDFIDLLAHLDGVAVAAHDLAGHGEAERPPAYRVVDYARRLPGLGPDRPVVYGHSLGALVALQWAAASPGCVRALVLEDPPVFESQMPRLLEGPFARGFAALRALKTGRGATFSLQAWRRELAASPSDRPGVTLLQALGEEGVARRARQLMAFDAAALEAPLAGALNDGFDALAAIRKARCPVTLIAGERARGSALTDGDLQLLAGEPALSVVRVEGAGHYVHEAFPACCAAIVRRLLTRA